MALSLSDKTLQGFFWLATSSGLQSVLQVIITAILARLLTPADFGLVAAAMIVILFTSMLYEMGVGPALVQLQNLDSGHINTAFTFSIILGFVLAFIFLIINPWIALLFDMPKLTPILNVLVWVLPFRSISQVSYSLLQKELFFKKMAGLDVLSYLIGFGVFGIGMSLLGFGVWALVWANLLQSICYSISLLVVTPHSKKLQINIQKLQELLAFGANFTIGKVFNFLARKGDYLIIGKFLGASSLGIYSRAYALMNAPNSIVGQVMGKVLFASIAKAQGSKEKLTLTMERGYTILYLLVLPFSFCCYILAPEIVRVLLGKGWEEVVIPFQILVFGMFFRVGYKLGANLLLGIGKPSFYTFSQIVYALLIIVGSYFGSKWGIIGVSIAVTFSIFVNFLFLTYLSMKNTDFSIVKWLISIIPQSFSFIFIGTAAYFSAQIFRDYNFCSIAIISFTIFIVGIIAFMINYFHSSFILGKHGKWLLNQVRQFLSSSHLETSR